MARHRWATEERTSSPDRLERVLRLNREEPDPDREWAWEAGSVDPASADGSGDDYCAAGIDGPRGTDRPGGMDGLPVAGARTDLGQGRRWAATRRSALVAAGCALVVGGWQFVGTDRGPGEIVPIGPTASGTPHASAGAAPTGGTDTPAEEGQATGAAGRGDVNGNAATVVVHVAGAVLRPGVVEAAAGSRVFEVLEKAGGALPEAELSAVNLAAVVQDGQQILIPRAGEPLPQPVSETAPSAGAGGGLINLNTAGVPDLEELPRVGPVLAERIVEWRTQHGPFARPEDLDAVPGIGPTMLESLLPLVTV